MDIPIVRWTDPENGEIHEDKVFCSDILDALTQDFFARKGNPIEEPPNVEEVKVTRLVLVVNILGVFGRESDEVLSSTSQRFNESSIHT